VTEADRGAEAAIRKLIGERYPEHGVIGEEYGEDRPDAEFVWVLDPSTARAPSSPACRCGPP
jgi:fructose-1,6-bisphosphatase/inositol monophosphatase family enzyme